MKDPKRRVLQEFLKLFADEKMNGSSQSSQTTRNKSSDHHDHDGRLVFEEKSVDWASDNEGYKTIFNNILSFLDEYDLALSIQPTCKLFQNFSKNDHLWECLFNHQCENFFCNAAERLKDYSHVETFKDRFVRLVRDHYTSSRKHTWGWFRLQEPSPVYKNKARTCDICNDVIEEPDAYLTRFARGYKGCTCHFDCVDKEKFRSQYPHILSFVDEDSPYKEELINSIYRTRIIEDNRNVNIEDDEEEEEVPEFSCDICEEPIYGIRYNCLDCEEYDLCGYCCEKVIMKQKGSCLKMCQQADHPIEHTFQSVGEEDVETYSCNKCKEKIRGYRYHKIDEEDFDLCTLCFFDIESKDVYEKVDLLGDCPVEALYTTLCEKMLLKELKAIFESIDESSNGMSKKELSSTLIEILNERKESNNRPSICHLVSSAERFCCKGDDGNVLPSNTCNALVTSLEIVDAAVKSPKKKAKFE